MDGKKAYKAFNFIMLAIIILIGLSLAVIIFLTKSNFFSKIDQYGCESSKGYAFSFAKNKCVLVYEEAARFQKTNSNNPNDLNAFVIFSNDNKSADIFMPGQKYALVTLKDNYTLWQDNKSYYSIKNLPDKLSLQENGTEIYFINRK